MPGNSRRPNRRSAGSKKGQVVGSGGRGRRALRGRGPTPPAQLRPGHPAARRTAGTANTTNPARAESTPARTPEPPSPQRPSRQPPGKDAPETVAGRNAVAEALRACVPAIALYVASAGSADAQASRIKDDRVREACRLAADQGVPLLQVPRAELDRLSGGAPHQGVVLQIPPYAYAHPDDLLAQARDAGEAPLVVVMDGVTDPRNLGAVVRSVAAFGGHGVVVPERRSAGMTAGAWKASAGTAARTPVARATNLTRTLQAYQEAGLFVVGLASSGEAGLDDLGDDLGVATHPLALVVGSEGKGLSRLVARTCDLRVRIPMAPGAESVNVSVAASLVLYEVARRRR